jgi:hypothetical protein
MRVAGVAGGVSVPAASNLPIRSRVPDVQAARRRLPRSLELGRFASRRPRGLALSVQSWPVG